MKQVGSELPEAAGSSVCTSLLSHSAETLPWLQSCSPSTLPAGTPAAASSLTESTWAVKTTFTALTPAGMVMLSILIQPRPLEPPLVEVLTVAPVGPNTESSCM